MTAQAPRSDADSVDISTGRPTSYEAGNMVDGDPETAWRVDGDASGETLRFTFDEPVTLTSVGLVNGYAKTSVDGSGTEFDLYAGGRRVLQVQWVLDGEAVIDQALSDGDRELQRVDTGAVEVTVVELRLVEVSAPGKGPAARDKTAVSEVSLEGYAG
ncbi:discoidin domain-containing protein [Nocardioides marinus]|uniref:discoidin domain-containing protein n=1 Tax=Nocardioides marinus TaxID=374514 RepID=UPI0039EDF352